MREAGLRSSESAPKPVRLVHPGGQSLTSADWRFTITNYHLFYCHPELVEGHNSHNIKSITMQIKNYTSNIEASKSMARIEELLVEIGATNINKQYENKICTGITFLLYDQQLQQTIPFHLKAQADECFIILWKEVKRPRHDTKATLQAQANKTAWKILSDWTEIQCSMILLGQAKPLQMFLPFMYDMKSNETLFDKVTCGKLKLLP